MLDVPAGRRAAASFRGVQITCAPRPSGSRCLSGTSGKESTCPPPPPAARGPLPTLKIQSNGIAFSMAIVVEEFEVEKFKFVWAKIEISKYVSELTKAIYFYVHK